MSTPMPTRMFYVHAYMHACTHALCLNLLLHCCGAYKNRYIKSQKIHKRGKRVQSVPGPLPEMQAAGGDAAAMARGVCPAEHAWGRACPYTCPMCTPYRMPTHLSYRRRLDAPLCACLFAYPTRMPIRMHVRTRVWTHAPHAFPTPVTKGMSCANVYTRMCTHVSYVHA